MLRLFGEFKGLGSLSETESHSSVKSLSHMQPFLPFSAAQILVLLLFVLLKQQLADSLGWSQETFFFLLFAYRFFQQVYLLYDIPTMQLFTF